jgi:hypothetical protein
MCGSGGGSGGSGTQKFEWNEQLMPHWMNALDEAQKLTDPERGAHYQQYPGQRIAGFDDQQEQAMGLIGHYVGAPQDFLYGKGNIHLQDTLAGKHLTGNDANPFVTNNAYEGENPYFEQVVGRGMTDITNRYKEATAPDTNAAAVLNGTLGGGDHQRLVSKNQEALARQLGDYSAQMRSGQYDRSANLYENYLNRGAGAFEGERGRQMAATGASQNDQALTFERYKQLMGVGDMQRGLTQDYLNQYLQDWQDQQNFPMKNLDTYTGILSRAQGGMAPNVTNSVPGYQANPFSQLMGAGLLGYGMFG